MEKKYEASMAIQVLPNITEQKEKLEVVDKVINYIKSKGLKTVVTPFETVIEGQLEEILEVLKESIKISGEKGVLAFSKISYNPLGVLTIDEKTKKYNI